MAKMKRGALVTRRIKLSGRSGYVPRVGYAMKRRPTLMAKQKMVVKRAPATVRHFGVNINRPGGNIIQHQSYGYTVVGAHRRRSKSGKVTVVRGHTRAR